MAQELTIGKLARLAKVNIETIRYYQRRGLLAEPKKPYMGYRRYPADIVKHIRFIKRAQALGFTLNEVTILMGLEAARACGKTRALAVDKINAIDDKLTALTIMRRALTSLVRQCDTGKSLKRCPIIQVLEQNGPGRSAR